jgi:rieske iron-sulfur protein
MMAETGDACGKSCRDGSTRRDVLTFASMLGLGAATCGALAPATAEPADERPKEGDFLVAIGAAAPVPLEPKDIANAEIIAWPLDPAGKIVRSGSRLNKVLLLRLDPTTLVGPTRERAADGVVAYSAICPHAGCEVDGWSAEQKILECPCHNSKYNPCDSATVVDGPSPRGLAALPLKIVEGRLVVAKPFIGRVGIAPT